MSAVRTMIPFFNADATALIPIEGSKPEFLSTGQPITAQQFSGELPCCVYHLAYSDGREEYLFKRGFLLGGARPFTIDDKREWVSGIVFDPSQTVS